MSQDKEWRPFEPCLENVLSAATQGKWIVEAGYAWCEPSFTQQEARLTADLMKKFDTGGPE